MAKKKRLSKRDKDILNLVCEGYTDDRICDALDISLDELFKSVRRDVVQEELRQMQKDLLTLSSFRRTKSAIEKSYQSPALQKTLFQSDGSLKSSPLINIDNRQQSVNEYNLISIRKAFDNGEPVKIPDVNQTSNEKLPRALRDLSQLKYVQLVSSDGKSNSLSSVQKLNPSNILPNQKNPQPVDIPFLTSDNESETEPSHKPPKSEENQGNSSTCDAKSGLESSGHKNESILNIAGLNF